MAMLDGGLRPEMDGAGPIRKFPTKLFLFHFCAIGSSDVIFLQIEALRSFNVLKHAFSQNYLTSSGSRVFLLR